MPADPRIIERDPLGVNVGVAIAALAMIAALILAPPPAHARSGASTAPGWAVAVFPGGEEFSVEIAADESSRRRGYMFREKVGDREGMLFVFQNSERHGFWMKNCRVRLDIIWLDTDFRVVDVAHDLAPCPETGECPTVEPLEVARFVLEVAGGTARRLGLKRNDRMTVLSEVPLR